MYIKRLMGVCSILFSLTVLSHAQTTVSDTLTTDQTWTVANSPYQVTDTLVVAQGVTLTINPGVTVQFNEKQTLIVEGAIIADGDVGSEITFTSSANTPAKGDWGTIRFSNTSGVGSVFDYVILEYGGASRSSGGTGAMISYRTGAYAFNLTNLTVRNSGGHGIDLRASSPLIEDSEFSNNNGYGVFSDLGLSYEIENSVFTGNTIGGIRVPINSTPSIQNSTISTNGVGIYIDNGAIPTIKNNTLDGNTVGIVVIEAAGQSPVITDNTIQNSTNFGLENRGNGQVTAEYNFWGHKSGPTIFLNPTGTGDKVSTNVDFNPWLYGATLPVVEITTNPVNGDVWSANTVYWVKNSITLNVGQTLTIEPGAVIKFGPNVDFNINGTLIADGTAEDKIFFTSQYDDAIGGDSNGDERATQPTKGNWRRVVVNESSQDNVFDYVDMRYGGYYGEMFHVSDASTSVTNSYFTDSNVNGIQLYRSLEAFRNITANNNRNTGIVISAPDSELRNLTAMYNGDHGLYINQRNLVNTVQIVGGTFNYNENHGIWSRETDSDYRSVDSLVGVTASYNGETGVVIEGSNVSEILVKDNVFSHNGNYGASPGVLSRLIEHFSGMTTAEFLQQRLFDPLGMEDTGYNVAEAKHERVASLHTYDEEGRLMVSPQQTPLTGNTVFGGGNGLFSTAEDYLAFCRLFLDNGQAPDGTQLLSPKTIDLIGQNHVGDLYAPAGYGFGLGFGVITNLADTKALGSVGQLSWSGAFRTFYFIDREENLAAVLMTQINPYNNFYGRKMPQFVYQAIVE